MYKRGIDFCIDREWPSCDWILSNFDKSELRNKGVFIKEATSKIVLDSGVSVIRESVGEIEISKNSVVTLHCQSNQLLTIRVHKGARLFLHLHNSPCIVIADEPIASAKVYRYDEVSTVKTDGNISVKNSFEK